MWGRGYMSGGNGVENISNIDIKTTRLNHPTSYVGNIPGIDQPCSVKLTFY